jgi:hypothetical protein
MAAVRALAAIVLALVAAHPTSGVHHTRAGVAAAHRMLLRAGDVGPGWTAGATPRKVGELTCGAQAPTAPGATETGSAVSPTYRAASGGPFVSQEVFVYSTPAGASAFWRHAVGAQTRACVAQSLTAASTHSVTLKVTGAETLAPPPVASRSAAFRVSGQATTSAQHVRVYVDVILLLRRNAITELSFSSFAQPVAHADELRIARRAAARL